MKSERGFIIEFWNKVFSVLESISLFKLIRKITGNRSYLFVEIYVISNLMMAVLLSLMVFLFIRSEWVLYVLIVFALQRVFEVIIYQINVLLFHPYRAHKEGREYFIKSPTRIVILLFHNYVEIIFWFTAIFISMLILSGTTIDGTWFYYIKSSVSCFATLNQDAVIQIAENNLQLISAFAFFEFISGLIMTTITLARFIGLLPAVKIKDEF